MPYTITWYLEKRIVHLQCYGTMSVEELMSWNEALLRHLDEGTAPVHIIIDVTELKRFPTNVIQLKNSARFLHHPTKGWLVMVGGSALVSSLTVVITQLLRQEFRGFRTLDTAVKFLVKEDKTLGSVAPNDLPKSNL